MQGKQKLVQHTTEVASQAGPIPSSYSPTISGLSAALSLLALWVAFRSNRRSDKVERINQFEREYGSELRNLFRQFESKLAELDAFVFPSGRSIDKQRDELAGVSTELELLSAKTLRILREMDDDETVQWSDWQTKAKHAFDAGQHYVEGALDITSSQPLLFQRAVMRGKEDYESGLSLLRRRLRRAAGRKSYPK